MRLTKALLFSATSALVLACGGDGRQDTDTLSGLTSGVTATEGDTTPTPTTTENGSTANPGSTDPSGTGTGVETMGGPTTSATATATATDGTTTVDPGTGGTTMEDPGMIVSIEIQPLDAIITVVDGQIPPATQYTAVGITDKGIQVPVTGTWDFDRPDLAAIGDQSGAFAATGINGGKGKVSFDGSGDLPVVSTGATVKLVYNADPGMVPPDVKDMFGMAVDPDPSMTLLYPYDKTVFPRGLAGPVIQWNGGGANDIYYIHAYNDFFEFKGHQADGHQSKIM